MKQFPASLFILLAIVVAITSAFTSNKKTFFPNTAARFGVARNAETSSSPAISIYASRTIDTFYKIVSLTTTDIDIEIESFNAVAFPVTVSCPSDSELCAVIVKYNNLTNPYTEHTLVDFKNGLYSVTD